jgi:AcrR family transcriptional regulator
MNAATPIETSQRHDLERAAVGLINEHGADALSVPAICAAAEVDEWVFWANFDSVEHLLTSLVESIVERHLHTIHATLMRRRSLTESMRVAMFAFWDTVEEQIDLHRAAELVKLSRMLDSSTVRPDTLQARLVQLTEAELEELERIHGITWQLPVNQLARMILVTLNGMVVEYLVTKDSSASRNMLEVFAYHVAQHGRRSAKNQPQ